MTADNVTEYAVRYHRRGWWVTPTSGKAPVLDDWPNRHLDEDGIREHFRPGLGVGVILGRSGLADLDFDDITAVRAYGIIAPPELGGAAVFKHGERPHIIVKAQDVETRRFKRADGSTLLEIRGDGAQTVFPPSVHRDGQPYVWLNDCDPPQVDAARLHVIALMTATAAYASESWTPGTRHDLALAVAGFLARRLEEADVVAVVRAAATVADDDEVADREQAVRTTVRRLQGRESVTGLPTIESLAPDLSNALASWWGAPAEPAGSEPPDRPSPRKSQADELVELGRMSELFHDATGAAFARLRVGDHREIWPLYSKRFKAWLRRGFFVDQDKVPGTDAVNAALGVLEGIACFDGLEHELHNRVARLDDAIYYDLADDAWRCVRISSSGWEIVNDPPILFRRYAHQRPQVEPAVGGDVRAILRFLNLDPSDHLLLLALLVGAFVPDIPHPIPDFHGEKGSGKSVGQRVLRRLIDPSSVETLTFPTDVRELVQQLSHHYAPVYDNVDQLSKWLSDALCRAVTGEGFSKRELYSDDEDVIYSYRRVIMLNGVNVAARRSDLLDRTILLSLVRIPRDQRREERAFWVEFEAARPFILGGILDSLALALACYPGIDIPWLERMADFTRFGAAVSQALGFGATAFLEAYSGNVVVQTKEAVEGHVVGASVLALMEGRTEWRGTPSELLAALEKAGEAAHLFRRNVGGRVEAKGWPGAPHILTRRLNEIRSNLTDLGIEIAELHGDQRTIVISRRPTDGPE